MLGLTPFAWLRRKVAESVVAGVADGLRAIAPEGEDIPAANLDELRAMLGNVTQVRALPAADEEPARGKKGR